MADLTLLLDALHRGEPDAAGALFAQVYAELRALARAKMAREQPGHTLQPTALVHERMPPDIGFPWSSAIMHRRSLSHPCGGGSLVRAN